MSEDRKLGPNMKRLLTFFIARLSVPPGGGFAAAIESLLSAERMKENAREGLRQVDQAITAMRAAPDKWYSDDEEEIAGIILAELDKR